MNEQPLVSIAMPVYNAEKYIKKTIESVLNQTYTNFELILINDASKDRSKEIIHSFSDSRIRYIENPENLGIVKTRNKCIQYARGKYIAVLDNDDITLPPRLAKQVEFLEENNDYGICGSFYDIIDGSDNVVHKMKLPVTNSQIKTFLLFNNCCCNSSVMIKSDIIKEQMYPEGFDMIEDYYFLHSASKSTKLFNLPMYITQYRVHGENVSIEKLDGMRSLRLKMDALILNDLKIPYSEHELLLHSNFVTSNFHFFKTNDQIAQLEAWLLKLYQALKKDPLYDTNLIQKILIKRWIILFRRTNNFSYKFFFNNLLLKFNIKYMTFLFSLLTEKYSKIKSIY